MCSYWIIESYRDCWYLGMARELVFTYLVVFVNDACCCVFFSMFFWGSVSPNNDVDDQVDVSIRWSVNMLIWYVIWVCPGYNDHWTKATLGDGLHICAPKRSRFFVAADPLARHPVIPKIDRLVSDISYFHLQLSWLTSMTSIPHTLWQFKIAIGNGHRNCWFTY